MWILEISMSLCFLAHFYETKNLFLKNVHALVKFPNIIFLMVSELGPGLLSTHCAAVIFLKKDYHKEWSFLIVPLFAISRFCSLSSFWEHILCFSLLPNNLLFFWHFLFCLRYLLCEILARLKSMFIKKISSFSYLEGNFFLFCFSKKRAFLRWRGFTYQGYIHLEINLNFHQFQLQSEIFLKALFLTDFWYQLLVLCNITRKTYIQ